MDAVNHQLRLAARPAGLPKPTDWELTEEPAGEPGEGEVLVKIRYVSLDPAMRGWMNDGRSYIAPVAIGEVMIEMARGSDGRFNAACGGDTFNTAVYMARAGIDVAYATALGDDSYSDGIVAMATAEGIKTDLILRVPGRLPRRA